MRSQSLTAKSWALLIAALLIVVYNVVLFVFALQHPTDGVSGHFEGQGIGIDAVPADSPLLVGDVLVEVNGRSLSEGINSIGAWQTFLLEPSTSGATYTLLRDGELVTLDVSWVVQKPLQVLSRLAPLSLVGLSFIAAVVLIIVSRVDDAAAWLLALEFCVQGLNLVNNAILTLGANLTLSLAWLFSPVDLLSFCLGMSLAMHVLLIFPERKWLARRMPWALFVLHIVNVMIAVVAMTGFGPGTLLQVRGFIYSRILYPLAAVELLVGVGHLIHTYYTTHRPGVRNQIRWVLWGTVLGPLPWLLLYNVPIALTGQPLVPLVVADIALILVPLSFSFSVTGRGLMAVDTLINRSLVYTGLTGLLLGFYVLVVSLVGQLFHSVFGDANTNFASIIAIVVIAVVAAPLRARMQLWVDRAFYRHWVDLKILLREVDARLSATLQLDAMITILIDEIPQRLHITQAALLLREDDGSFLGQSYSEIHLTGTHPLVNHFESRGELCILRDAHNVPIDVADLLQQQWEMALPLRRRGELIGIYLLGPRLSGDLYGRDEIETVMLLGQQIAVTLENTYLYHQIEVYSQDLETLVAERTHELGMTNDALSQERDRLNVIIENMADGLLVVSRDGHIQLVNPAFEHMIASEGMACLGRALNEVMDCEPLFKIVEQAYLDPGEVLSAHCELGTQILQASSTTLNDDSGTITVLRDVTHEVEVDRIKTEFISTVSHELRTPLTSVLGFTKLIAKSLARDVASVIPADARKAQRAMKRIISNLDIINAEGDRLTRLINDVLDIAKMEAKNIEWRDRPIDLIPLIENAVDAVHEVALESGDTIYIDVAGALPRLIADPKRIRQVLLNLLSNAIKFTDEGVINVRVRNVSSTEMTNRWDYSSENVGGILVSIEDSGNGIPESELRNLFQRFKQIQDDVLVNKPQGTGLGLAICREIVLHYKGFIWAESELGKGSKFQFVLPITTYIPLEAAAQFASHEFEFESMASDAVVDESATVLIADDESHIRELLRQELVDAGYRILEATNGSEALAMARRYRPTLVLLDVMMPDISGFDVTKILKSDPATSAIPVLILSIIEDREYGLSLGADAYLTKPIETVPLLRTISTLVAHQPSQRQPFDEVPSSVMEHITGALRNQGFEVVQANAAQQHTSDDHVSDVGKRATASDLDWSVLDEMLAKLNPTEHIKIMRFEEPSQIRTVIVVEGRTIVNALEVRDET